MRWNTPKQISLAALFVLIYWVNTQTRHMFHPCSLAKIICANVTSDEWFMRHLREKAVNFYNVNRKEGRMSRQAGRVRGQEWSMGAVKLKMWSPDSTSSLAPCLHFPLISSHQPSSRAHGCPARQQSWQTRYSVAALSNALHGTAEYVCFSLVLLSCKSQFAF